jgi:hypothetical protein
MRFTFEVEVPDGSNHPPQQDFGSLAIAIEELTDTWFQAGTRVYTRNSGLNEAEAEAVLSALDGFEPDTASYDPEDPDPMGWSPEDVALLDSAYEKISRMVNR